MKYEQKPSKFTGTRPARNWLKLILLLFVPLSLLGCASAPTVLTKVEIREVLVPVRTPLDPELLTDPEPCTLPPTPEFYFFDLDVWALCLENRDVFRTNQLKRIREANGAEIPPDGG